jgi:hypothetical protein
MIETQVIAGIGVALFVIQAIFSIVKNNPGGIMPGKKGVRRVRDTSATELRDYAKRLKTVASEMEGAARAMDKKQIVEITVEGHAGMESAFKAFGKFVGNCEKQVKEF